MLRRLLIFPILLCCLLILGIADVFPVVEVIYEEPVGLNPFGHSAIRIDDRVYDVNKEGEGTGETQIRERNWQDVLDDERGQQTAEPAG